MVSDSRIGKHGSRAAVLKLGSTLEPPGGLVQTQVARSRPGAADADPAGLAPPSENLSSRTCTKLQGQNKSLSSFLQPASLSLTLRVSTTHQVQMGSEPSSCRPYAGAWWVVIQMAGIGRLREGPILKYIFPTDSQEAAEQTSYKHLLYSQIN